MQKKVDYTNQEFVCLKLWIYEEFLTVNWNPDPVDNSKIKTTIGTQKSGIVCNYESGDYLRENQNKDWKSQIGEDPTNLELFETLKEKQNCEKNVSPN